MIPELPNTVSDLDRIAFYETLLGNLEDQSTIHTNWHTHRQNPATCWICDLSIIGRKILDICDKNISKSPLDMETELSSEDDSDSEIENEFSDENDNTYNEPEFEVDEDGYMESSEEQN